MIDLAIMRKIFSDNEMFLPESPKHSSPQAKSHTEKQKQMPKAVRAFAGRRILRNIKKRLM